MARATCTGRGRDAAGRSLLSIGEAGSSAPPWLGRDERTRQRVEELDRELRRC
eukprot:CAMPEP_0181172932 /NCGR_PEP_ID=MMETSP1096-20121128/2717_1 /TAXON_ID=156174 ORGANISM="Chrysochromulina ericina, Strain CCMP281" /NCGR_SAMPLE_ID=MMETSP1096 /ASSEMBLY_ACC=CAM_ASM_000453 /LENGTH=52 /DNA_ID=CAMNT_0023260701 /DNA_START=242 /DNA_END=400 /DNA_ORIENTATION=-